MNLLRPLPAYCCSLLFVCLYLGFRSFIFCDKRSEFSLENEVLKPFFLAGIFGCPTVRKFRKFVAAIASLLLFVVVCLSLSGVSFIVHLFFATSMGIFLFCVVLCLGHCMHMRETLGRAWVNSTNLLRRLPLFICLCRV